MVLAEPDCGTYLNLFEVVLNIDAQVFGVLKRLAAEMLTIVTVHPTGR